MAHTRVLPRYKFCHNCLTAFEAKDYEGHACRNKCRGCGKPKDEHVPVVAQDTTIEYICPTGVFK